MVKIQQIFDFFAVLFGICPSGKRGPGSDEAFRIRRRNVPLRVLLCAASGTLYAVALPPFNQEWAVFVALVPLLGVAVRDGATVRGNLLYGWCWGLGWALFAFRFLREIDPVVPWLLAPVISLWPAVWTALLPGLWRNIIYPDAAAAGGFDGRREYRKNGIAFWRMLVFCLVAAALFTLLEYSRSRLFTWNDFAGTQYRNLPLLQVAAFTGHYGVGWLAAFGNLAIFSLFFRGGRRVAVLAATVFAAVYIYGYRTLSRSVAGSDFVTLLAVQGDLSQRRHATGEQGREALNVYSELTRAALASGHRFDAIVWPESAVPVPFYSTRRLAGLSGRLSSYGELCRDYQETVRQLAALAGRPLLFGAIDYETVLPGAGGELRATNSALLMAPDGNLIGRYDKMHRVPFGEYIPGRDLLPDFIVKYIDMGRDLAPGKNPRFLEIAPGARAGVSVCFEGVFSYHVRELVSRGANFLLVISNDAWYPESSEPEQHLANAVLRAVETGLAMARVGNNGGTGVVLPSGRFTQCPATPGGEIRPELGRGRATVRLEVPLAGAGFATFYSRRGEWFAALLALVVVAGEGWSAAVALRRRRHRLELLRKKH